MEERKPAIPHPLVLPSPLTLDTSKLADAVATDSYAVTMSNQVMVKWSEDLLPHGCLSPLLSSSPDPLLLPPAPQ